MPIDGLPSANLTSMNLLNGIRSSLRSYFRRRDNLEAVAPFGPTPESLPNQIAERYAPE
jgi:hypothetical protein